MMLLGMLVALIVWNPHWPAAAQGQADTAVSLFPPALAIPLQETAELNIIVDNVEGLYAAELTLHFDPTVLQVLDVRVGPMLEGATPILRVDNTGGTLLMAATLIPPAPATSGSGSIASIFVRGVSEGGTVLTMDVILSRQTGEWIPARISGGIVNVGQDIALPTPTPVPLPTESPVPSPTVPPPAVVTLAPSQPAAVTPTVPAMTAGAPAAPATPASSPAQPLPMITVAPAGGSLAAPSKAGGGLPDWLFVMLLVGLLGIAGVLGIVVLWATWAWYRRSV